MQRFTVLCLASYEKGHEFLRESKALGHRVLLLTSLSLKDASRFPMEAIDEIFYMPDVDNAWNRQHAIDAITHLQLHHRIDRLVALDEFDIELAACIRAQLAIPGMDETTTRRFRDKLTMRITAAAARIPVPAFQRVVNYEEIHEFLARTPPPYVLKPRQLAGAIGIRKIYSSEEFWQAFHSLDGQQAQYLLERFVPGDVFHVDSIVVEGRVIFSVASGYGRPPLEVAHGGGVFTSRLLERGVSPEPELLAMNETVLQAMGHTRGVAHTEFIRAQEDGRLYFLETAARVGGAHLADLVRGGTGIDLWGEWGKLESDQPYRLPPGDSQYAGLVISLARQEHPDTSAYDDPEVIWRMDEKHHVGLIVRSPSYARIEELLQQYAQRAARDFGAFVPIKDRKPH